jgi:hypothetical protein
MWAPSLPARDAIRPDEVTAYDWVVEDMTSTDWTAFVRAFLHPEVREALPDDRIQPYYQVLLNSPLVSEGIHRLLHVHLTRSSFPDGMQDLDREWAGLVMCNEVDLFWVAYVHTPNAIAVGIRPEAIRALFEDRPDDLTPDEREKADFIRAVITGAVTEERYRGMERLVGPRATVEITCMTGFLIMMARQMQAFGVPGTTREHLIEWLDHQAKTTSEV